MTDDQRLEIASRGIVAHLSSGEEILLLDEKAAQMCEQAGMRLLPHVSHAHGFHMAVKRDEIEPEEEIF